ncbi:hypothetical protein [Agrococcus sp. Ld7]|uniref:hypothetical protein n=1 Tax=Agrococcus sp. Ld7 TaxID=649148 RepID=UPI00386B8404
MHRCRPIALGAPALIALLVITGCAQSTPARTAPPSPSQTPSPSPTQVQSPSPSPTVDATATAAPTATVAAPSAGRESPTTDDWTTYAVGDDHTSWSMPAGWVASIEREVVEGNADWTDYRGLIRDEAGTPMLRFEAIGSGGQYATDFAPCERPRTEVFESVPLGEQVLDRAATASVTTLAYAANDGGIVFASGVSDNDPEAACEPGILALYQAETPAGYDFLVLEIVDDAGESAPVFASFEAARAYLETDEYAAIRGVLTSFHSR